MVTAHNKKSPINKTKLQLFGAIDTRYNFTLTDTHTHIRVPIYCHPNIPIHTDMYQWINTDSDLLIHGLSVYYG
jgi:hypothetical protein